LTVTSMSNPIVFLAHQNLPENIKRVAVGMRTSFRTSFVYPARLAQVHNPDHSFTMIFNRSGRLVVLKRFRAALKQN